MKLLQAIVGGALVVLVFLLVVFNDGWPDVAIRFAILACGLAQIYITYRTVTSSAQARADTKVEMKDQLAPLAYALAGIPGANGLPQRRTAIASFIAKAVASCVSLTDEKRTRATFYEIDGDVGERVFSPTLSHGRGDRPRSSFGEGDGADGDVVWSKATAGEPTFVEDWTASPPPHFDLERRDRKYLTFITVPVLLDSGPVGLLTINAQKPGDLTSSDVETMQMIADLCAVAIGMGDGKCPPLGGH